MEVDLSAGEEHFVLSEVVLAKGGLTCLRLPHAGPDVFGMLL